jgi:hypothetical protein
MAVSEQASMDAAVRYVVSKYSPKGNWVGWLMDLALGAGPGGGPGGGNSVPAARPAGNGDLVDPPRSSWQSFL